MSEATDFLQIGEDDPDDQLEWDILYEIYCGEASSKCSQCVHADSGAGCMTIDLWPFEGVGATIAATYHTSSDEVMAATQGDGLRRPHSLGRCEGQKP